MYGHKSRTKMDPPNCSRPDMGLYTLFTSVLKTLCSFLHENATCIAGVVIIVLALFVVYKSYFSPVLYIKELTDVGFDHIKGRDRALGIVRAQVARRLGCKLPPPYPNGWFAIAESRDLKIGDVVPVDVLGQNLCLYRGQDGIAYTIDAYCPHLGANIAIGGEVNGSCVECPFHKWRFSGEGTCVGVPGLESPPQGVAVKNWTTREADGAVWIWHDVDGCPPKWPIENAEQLPAWGYRGRNEFTVNSHVQDIPENGADVAHLSAVHSPSLLTGLGERYPALSYLIGRHCWSAEWSRRDDHTATMRLTHDYKFGKIAPAVFRIEALATQMGPGHVRLLINTAAGPMLVSQSVTPIGPMMQRVVHRVFSPKWNAPIAVAFLRGESHMFERDVAVWNHKRFASAPAYVKSDKTIRAFRSWFSQFYSENSLSFMDAYRKQNDPLDW